MRLPFTARHLYLLALFQLIGGPLVLIPVLTVGKIVVTTPQQQGFSSGVAELIEQEIWHAVTLEFVRGTQQNAEPSRDSSDVPVKKKDGKPAFTAIAWQVPPPLLLLFKGSSLPHEQASHLIGLAAQAPPGPPPRRI